MVNEISPLNCVDYFFLLFCLKRDRLLPVGVPAPPKGARPAGAGGHGRQAATERGGPLRCQSHHPTSVDGLDP